MDTTLIGFAASVLVVLAVFRLIWAFDRVLYRRLARQEQQARAEFPTKVAKSRERAFTTEVQGRWVRLDSQEVFAPLSKKERRVLANEQLRMRRQEAQLAKAAARANAVGPRIRLIGALLPVGDEWRVEEMMNHRNELREEFGRVPLFHYVRLFLSALEIRWEARVYPERQVD